MSIFQAFILGIVQGITELLPISSSAHLILIPNFFGWEKHSLVFDTTLHLATACALIVYFRKEILGIIKALFSDVFRFKFNVKKYSKNGLLGIVILVGSIPAGILAVLLGDKIEMLFRGTGSVVLFLTLGSLLMIFADMFFSAKIKNIGDIKFGKSFVIGLFQSLALFSGVSRSGATISGGMLLGLERSLAARFSFLLSIPIILSAGIFQAFSSAGQLESVPLASILTGFLSSFIFGLLAIKFLMGFLGKHKLTGFIIYRLVLVLAISLML
jgi:undecaprenyl-diphosphatase